jgi:transposase
MAMGKRRRHAKQASMWVATQDLPRSAGHPFYTRLNHILDKADFDGYVESLCQRFYADEIGRPALLPRRYFRMLCSDTSKDSTLTARLRGAPPIR